MLNFSIRGLLMGSGFISITIVLLILAGCGSDNKVEEPARISENRLSVVIDRILGRVSNSAGFPYWFEQAFPRTA